MKKDILNTEMGVSMSLITVPNFLEVGVEEKQVTIELRLESKRDIRHECLHPLPGANFFYITHVDTAII